MDNKTTGPTVRIGVVIGSIRQNRFAELPAAWIADHLNQHSGVDVRLFDLRDYALPLFDEPVSPSMLGDGAYEQEAVARWTRDVEETDGFVLVGPEYNHGYSPALKNALDYVFRQWNRKPVGFVGYGAMGGARAIEQLRQVVVELEMAPMRTAVHLPLAPLMAHYTGGDVIQELAESNDKATAMIDELLWWTRALKQAREAEALALTV